MSDAKSPLSAATREAIRQLLPKLDLHELGEVHAFVRARAAYRNHNAAPRQCDHCSQVYRGPAIYCSLRCALAGAAENEAAAASANDAAS